MPDSNIKINENIISNSCEKTYKVSAIISTFNSEEFIKGRLDNLLDQTINSDLEIIIINSNSKEDEDGVIRTYLEGHKNITYIVTDKTETIYQAWNRGIKHSKGAYITNANTDDRHSKIALETLSNVLDNNKNIAAVYADQFISNIPNQTFEEIKNGKSFRRAEFSRIRLLNDCIVGSQVLWRASLHHDDKIWFNEEMEIAGDYEFFCRVAEKYTIKYFDQILGVYFMSAQSSNKEYQSKNKTLMETLLIKVKYSRRYIESLDKQEVNKLQIKITLAKAMPFPIYRLCNFIIKCIVPAKRLPERLFYIYLGSVIAEVNNDKKYAINLLKGYLKENYPLINYHYKRLVENEI